MKVIDLLNKIVNGEEVPEYVKYKNHHSLDMEDTMMVCKENLFYKLDQLEIYLNDEIELIEEDKEIEKLERINGSYLVDLRSDNSIEEQSEAITNLIIYLNNNVDKLNELIKAVNELKKGK